jgi:hypothetical protein
VKPPARTRRGIRTDCRLRVVMAPPPAVRVRHSQVGVSPQLEVIPRHPGRRRWVGRLTSATFQAASAVPRLPDGGCPPSSACGDRRAVSRTGSAKSSTAMRDRWRLTRRGIAGPSAHDAGLGGPYVPDRWSTLAAPPRTIGVHELNATVRDAARAAVQRLRKRHDREVAPRPRGPWPPSHPSASVADAAHRCIRPAICTYRGADASHCVNDVADRGRPGAAMLFVHQTYGRYSRSQPDTGSVQGEFPRDLDVC